MACQKEFLCRVCGEEISFASGGVACRACATLHHRACWEYAGRCSTYACGEAQFAVCDAEELSGTAVTLPAPVTPAHETAVAARSDVDEAAMLGAVMQGTTYCPECHAVNPVFARGCAYCDFPLAKAALLDPTLLPRREKPLVPVSILIVRSVDRMASCLIGAAGMLLLAEGLAGLCLLDASTGGATVLMLLRYAAFGPVLLVSALLLHLVSSFYEMGHAWARRVQLPISLLMLVFYPFGTILGMATLMCWLSPSAARYFRGQAAPAPVLLPY